MKRRGFLRILTGAAAAIAVGVSAKPVAEIGRITTSRIIERDCTINPAWVSAPYEETFMFHESELVPTESAYRGFSFGFDPHPYRYDLVNGAYKRVSPFICVR